MRRNDDGELIKRWEELKRKWGPYWIPSMVVSKMLYDYIEESRKDYPKWEQCIEDIADGINGNDALMNYIRKMGKWVLRWK